MLGLGSGGTTVLASVTRALLGREPRLPEEGDGIDVRVKGIALSVRPQGARVVRLSSMMAQQLPQDETALRRLMERFLGACESNDNVLCVDGEGRLMLIGDIAAGEDVEAFVKTFCNAAVYFARQAARTDDHPVLAPGPVLIFP